VKKFFNSNAFYSILALLCAILLSVYTNNSRSGLAFQQQRPKTMQTATRTQTISVPLQVSVDADRYYVVGYPEKVKITLEGSAALVTSTVNTRSFRVYIDITKASVGKHTVPVKVSGLSKQLKYSIKPSKVRVNVQKRKTRTMPVQIEYNKNAVAKGYTIGTATSDPRVVTVAGSVSEMKELHSVTARLNLSKGVRQTVSQQVILTATDKNGKPLNVVIDPATVLVKLPIKAYHKDVKVKLATSHEQANKIYSLTAKQSRVRLYGSKKALKKISQVNVNVDLADVKQTGTYRYKAELPEGVAKADPAEVAVKIRVAGSSPVDRN
jgi:YbbR domain-containing protein